MVVSWWIVGFLLCDSAIAQTCCQIFIMWGTHLAYLHCEYQLQYSFHMKMYAPCLFSAYTHIYSFCTGGSECVPEKPYMHIVTSNMWSLCAIINSPRAHFWSCGPTPTKSCAHNAIKSVMLLLSTHKMYGLLLSVNRKCVVIYLNKECKKTLTILHHKYG